MSGHDRHSFVFVGGLHRSGTSLLARSIAEHPAISPLRNTGAIEDEGQHLQSVYPPGSVYGGPGRFGFHPDAHLTEDSPLISAENSARLFSYWRAYWDLSSPVLLEKSPPNLIKMRFLQALFPDSSFVVIIRHPIPVAFSTQKWSKTSLRSLIRHWVVCHERFSEDRNRIERLFVVRYEDFAQSPTKVLQDVFAFLHLDSYPVDPAIEPGLDSHYFERWLETGMLRKAYRYWLEREFEARINPFGYSLRNLDDSRARLPSAA